MIPSVTENPVPQSVKRLKERLLWCPVQQADLAAAMEWHESYLSHIFAGRRTITEEKVLELNQKLDRLIAEAALRRAAH